MRRFNRRWFEMADIDKHTVDIDSSVISRFGEQEGVAVGYNPKRHGRAFKCTQLFAQKFFEIKMVS